MVCPFLRNFAGNQIILGMQQKNETYGYAVGVQEFDWIRELNISKDRRTIEDYRIVQVK